MAAYPQKWGILGLRHASGASDIFTSEARVARAPLAGKNTTYVFSAR